MMSIDRRRWIQISGAAAAAAAVGARSAPAAMWNGRVLPLPPGEVRPVVTGLSYAPTTRRLASAGDDHLVRIWDLATARVERRLAGHRDWVRSVAMIGETVFSGGNDRTLRLWRLGDEPVKGEVVWRAASPIVRIAVSADSKWLGLCCFAGDAHWFSIGDWRNRGEIDSDRTDLRCVAFSEDGKIMATAGRDGVLRWVDLTTGRQQRLRTAHRRRRDLLFLDQHRVIAGGDDGLACLIDLNRPEGCRDLRCEKGRVFALAKIDRQTIATAGSDNVIRIWNVARGTREAELKAHTGTVSAMCWTGTHLISAGYDTTIRVWSRREPVAGGALEDHHR